MKHTNIAKVLGWNETPDVVEGIFLQPEEAAIVDAALGNVTAAEEVQAQLETANGLIAEGQEIINGLQTAATEAANLATTQAARITELEAEVETLGGQSSGTGTSTVTKSDTVSDEKVPWHLSDENPANQFADKHMKKKQ